jgi:hypothetical protein
MAQYRIPLEIFQKACLLEWLDQRGSETSVVKRLLKRVGVDRSKPTSSSFGYSFHRLKYSDILDEMRTSEIAEYIEQKYAISIRHFSRAKVLDREYEDDDVEGLADAIKRACRREFGEEGYYPSDSLTDLITNLEQRTRKISCVLSNRSKVIELLGGNRHDIERYLKFLTHFCCLIDKNLDTSMEAWQKFEVLQDTRLSKITAYLRSFNPGTLFESNISDHIENLRRVLGQSLSGNQEAELERCSREIFERTKESGGGTLYRIDVIRELGNVFHHEGYDYELVRQYTELLSAFLRDLKSYSPEIVNIVSVELNADGYYTFRVSARGEKTKTVIYTNDTIKSSYIPLKEKSDINSSENGLLLREAFLFPKISMDEADIISPLMCERGIVKPVTISDVQRSRLVIEIECEPAETPPISPTPLQGED